jgi:hypothetical protein
MQLSASYIIAFCFVSEDDWQTAETSSSSSSTLVRMLRIGFQPACCCGSCTLAFKDSRRCDLVDVDLGDRSPGGRCPCNSIAGLLVR